MFALPPHPLAVALQFLTRLPIRLTAAPDTDTLGRSVIWYPVVGVVIGGLLTPLVWLPLPPGVGAVLLVIAWALLTGGLHLDGLADSADAWLGGHGDRERTLALMKDPASGPAGVAAVTLTLLLKAACLQELLACHDGVAILVAALLARAALAALLITTPYARENGLGQELAEHAPHTAVALAVGLTALAAFLLHPAGGRALLLLALLGAALRRMMISRLGGTTGDTAGALAELGEAMVLVALTA